MRIKHINVLLGRGLINLKICFFKGANRFRVSNIIELIPLNNSGWKQRVSEVFMFNIKERDVVREEGCLFFFKKFERQAQFLVPSP